MRIEYSYLYIFQKSSCHQKLKKEATLPATVMIKAIKTLLKHGSGLSEDQRDQMCNIMEKITKIGAEEHDSSLKKDDKHGIGPAIRAIWKNDLQNLKKEFDQDQNRNCELVHMLNTMSGSCNGEQKK